MKKDKAFNPVRIRQLSPATVMFEANFRDNLIKKFGRIVLILLWWLWVREIVVVRAIDTVPLFDPSSLAGAIGDSPKVVGQLKPGEELKVIACVDTKSDFDIHASYQGQIVAVGEWKAKMVLYRRHAYPWQQGAITSCLGLFEHVSKHA